MIVTRFLYADVLRFIILFIFAKRRLYENLFIHLIRIVSIVFYNMSFCVYFKKEKEIITIGSYFNLF